MPVDCCVLFVCCGCYVVADVLSIGCHVLVGVDCVVFIACCVVSRSLLFVVRCLLLVVCCLLVVGLRLLNVVCCGLLFFCLLCGV